MIEVVVEVTRLVFTRALGIPWDDTVQRVPLEAPSFRQFVEAQQARQAQRRLDCLSVLVDNLLLALCSAQQTAYFVLLELVRLESSSVNDALRTLLHGRREYEQCNRLVPQQQMGVYGAMELALRLQAFSATEPVVQTVITEALRNCLTPAMENSVKTFSDSSVRRRARPRSP